MLEWATLKTNEEMFKAVQIPEGRLRRMCTIGVVDSWLTFPLRSQYAVRPAFQLGFERLEENFNGLRELLSRPDAGGILFRKYKLSDPSGYDPNGTLVEIGQHMSDLLVLELTLAQYSILGRFTQQEKKDLVREALIKRERKMADPAYVSTQGNRDALGNATDAYIMVRIMIQDEYRPFMNELDIYEIDYFSKNANYIYKESSENPGEHMSKIIFHAKNYLEN